MESHELLFCLFCSKFYMNLKNVYTIEISMSRAIIGVKIVNFGPLGAEIGSDMCPLCIPEGQLRHDLPLDNEVM